MQLSATQKRFVRRWGEMGTRWGISRSTAMVHGYLYLCRHAVNAEDICEALKLARSNVSTSLKELEQYRLVERESMPGDRRTFYTAVSDVWEMARRILEERRQRETEGAVTAVNDCLLAAREEGDDFTAARMEAMQELLSTAENVADAARRYPTSLFRKAALMGGKLLGLIAKL